MDILEEIVAHKRRELAERKSIISVRYLEEALVGQKPWPKVSMREALMGSDTGIIAEFKRKSPSKGWIHRDAKAETVTLDYQKNGATALSILTDTEFFGGYDEFVLQARAAGATLPMLYKNFVIDPYQLLQAKYCGASAVLLIAACLTKEECRDLLQKAHALDLEVLLEMHGERDFEYAELEPDMYGINNRNLGTFVTDVNNSFRLAGRLPKGQCLVSESGISDAETVKALREAGFRGFLMGEHFMRADRPGDALSQFVQQLLTPVNHHS